MPEVLFSNDDLTVLGSPEIVELSVDFGPQGQRGSQFYVGIGDPNTLTSGGVLNGQIIQLNDLYINAAPGVDYSFLYQYISQPGGASWVKVIRVNPVLYSKLHELVFVNGQETLPITISNIITTSGSPLTADNFNVQYQIRHTNPIASSMTISQIDPGDTDLHINFVATEYDGTNWVDFTGNVVADVFISIMV